MSDESAPFLLHWSDHFGSVHLTFSAPSTGDGYVRTFDTSIRGDSMSASVRVVTLSSDVGGDGLCDFFDGLAQDFRGWDGVRTWESLEHQLGFDAVWGTGGRVNVKVWATPNPLDKWRVSADFVVEAGEEMAKLASKIRLFFDQPGR